MKIFSFLLPTIALLFALIVIVNESNPAYGINRGNALWHNFQDFIGEDTTNGVGSDPEFDYNNPDPTAYEQSWHLREAWFLNSSHHESGGTCDGLTEGSTCGGGVSIPGLPSNYNPDYATEFGYNVAGLNVELLPNVEFPTTPVDRNDPFNPLADDTFNNANALGPNPGRMLRTLTEKGSFATFSPFDPFTPQRAGIGGRTVPSLGELDTIQTKVYVISHDVFLPVDVDNTQDNGGRADGIRVGDYGASLFKAQLDLRAGDVELEGRVIVGNSQTNSRATFNMTGGSLSLGSSAESTLNIQGGPLQNFRDAAMFIGTGGGGNAPGVFNHMAGDVSISGALFLTNTGGTFGAKGTYNMSSGTTLTLHRLGGDETAMISMGDGAEAIATFNQNGGTVTVDAGVHLGRHGGVVGIIAPLDRDPGLGIYNLVGSSSAAGDFDLDGDVDGSDFLLWQRGGSPNGTGSGDLGTWTSSYGSAGGGGGTTTLIQGTSTTSDGETGESQKDALIVGNAGFGELNIDSSAGDVVVDANAIILAALDTFDGGNGTGTAPSTGLIKITGENATITTGSLAVGDGAATFEFISASSISSIDVVAGHNDPANTGDVDIDGAALVVDLTTSPPPAGDLLLIGVGGTLTGEFTGLGEGAAVPGSGGYTISYLFGDGNDIGLIAPGAITAVPEPTSIALCLLATIGAACFRKR